MKRIRYKAMLFVLCMSLVIGTASVGFVGAVSETITVFEQVTCSRGIPANTTITIPCFQSIESIQMEIEGYCGDGFRALWFSLDGDWPPTEDGVEGGGYIGTRGGYIGTWRLDRHQVRDLPSDHPDYDSSTDDSTSGTISGGQTNTWIFDMTHCMVAYGNDGPFGTYENPDPGFYWINFIPECQENTVGYFSPGDHTVYSMISSDTYTSWISLTLYFEYTPCVEGSLFSDALVILPVTVLAGTLVVLRKRK